MSNTTATVITLDTLITVPDAYFSDAVWNLTAVMWGWPLNIFILYAGLGPRVKGRFKYAIIGMTACQLYGTVGETLLYTLYFIFQQTKTPITVLQCSVVRRVLQVTVNPPTMSILVCSIDRYCAIIHGKEISKIGLTILFMLPFVYAHLFYNLLTILPLNIGTSDMCGPCLKMPEEFSVFLEPIVPLTIAVAVGFNARILWYLFRYHRNRVATTQQQFSTKELRDMQSAMVGVTLQACVPLFFNLPQVINLAMYNFSASLRMPHGFWVVINFFNYFTLFLNPLVTILFVKQFRQSAYHFITRKELMTSTVIAPISNMSHVNFKRKVSTVATIM